MTPKQSADVPTLEDLDRRWPGFNPDLVEELLEDYRWEREQLDSPEIERLYEQIETLVRQDIAEEETMDDVMLE